MFAVAEDLLQQAGMGFRDVVRTWIHLREMDRDYADLNRARRFIIFQKPCRVNPFPARLRKINVSAPFWRNGLPSPR